VDVYRNASYSLLIAVVASLFLIASVVAAAVNEGPWAPVGVVAVLSLFCLLRLARAGVYADGEGIRVLNPLRTVRVPWDHVLRFTLKASKGFPAVGFAELIDGREIQIWGIQSRSYTTAARRIPEEVVAALNERLAAERGARQPTP
jgi:hypothetical protein